MPLLLVFLIVLLLELVGAYTHRAVDKSMEFSVGKYGNMEEKKEKSHTQNGIFLFQRMNDPIRDFMRALMQITNGPEFSESHLTVLNESAMFFLVFFSNNE